MKVTILIFIIISSSKTFAADTLKYVRYERTNLSDTLRLRLKSEIEWITPLNLSFCLEEILSLIKNETGFKVKWSKKISNYHQVFNDSLSYYLSDKEIHFFEQTSNRNDFLLKSYSSEIEFLNAHRFGNHYSHKDVLPLLKKYPLSDNKKALSTLFLTSIIIEGERFVKRIETDPGLKHAFDKWLQDIQDMEFVVSESINYAYEIVKRKREYIISCYGASLHPEMKKLIEAIKKSKITIID